jgi:hypothetical protein
MRKYKGAREADYTGTQYHDFGRFHRSHDGEMACVGLWTRVGWFVSVQKRCLDSGWRGLLEKIDWGEDVSINCNTAAVHFYT